MAITIYVQLYVSDAGILMQSFSRIAHVLAIVICAVTEGFASYFIDPVAGNDVTGDGTELAPWRTVQRAYHMVPGTGGYTVYLAPGTYEANVWDAKCWALLRRFNAPVVFTSSTGNAADVTIVPAPGGRRLMVLNQYYPNAWNHVFRSLTFNDGRALDANRVIEIDGAADVRDLTFEDCVFNGPIGAPTSATLVHVRQDSDAARPRINLNFRGCTFNGNAGNSLAFDVSVKNPTTSDKLRGITIEECTGTFGRFAWRMQASNVEISDCNFTATASAGGYGILIGRDTVPETLSSLIPDNVIVFNNVVNSPNSHGILAGGGSTNVHIAQNTVIGGDQGIVIKEAGRCQVVQNEITLPTSLGISGLYAKAGVNVLFSRNSVTTVSGSVFRVGPGDTGNMSSGITSVLNTFRAEGTAQVLRWSDATGDLGGGISRRNRYERTATASYGNVRGTSITGPSSFRTAWNGYDVKDNDATSSLAMVSPGGP
jgi:hypothetical protein